MEQWVFVDSKSGLNRKAHDGGGDDDDDGNDDDDLLTYTSPLGRPFPICR
jgi:hypothetical protein